jgi:HEAT repeat protein
VLCAERLLADGKNADAVRIYDELRKADLPKQSILEATRGAILARKADGVSLLVEQLRSPDKVFFQLGLGTARELMEPEVAKALLAEIVGAKPDRAALMLYVIADRRDPGVLPAVLEATTSGDQQVRVAAINILPRIGDESCVPTLLKLADTDEAELAAAAKAALAGLPGAKVDAAITGRLASADNQSLPLLIELVGMRRIDAKADLLKAVGNPQPAVRNAAWMALGATVAPNDLSLLVNEVVTPRNAEDAKQVQQALRAACIRMPERDVIAEQLTGAMKGLPLATQCTLLEILGSMGGEKALATIAAAAKGSDEQLQDTATRSLGEWMNVEAAPVLLDLAKTLTTSKYQVRAMRGYIRLARQFASNDKQRLEMCQAAMAAASRPDEQKLVLDILSRIPNMQALKQVVKASEKPELQADAVRSAKAIYDKLREKTPEAKALMAKLPGEK